MIKFYISYDIIQNINTPLLMVHGTVDDIIPHSHSEKLLGKANDPKKLIIYPGKGHNNLDTREIFKEMTAYFGLLEDSNIGVNGFVQN